VLIVAQPTAEESLIVRETGLGEGLWWTKKAIRVPSRMVGLVMPPFGNHGEARPEQGFEQKIPEQLEVNEEPKREGKLIAFPVLNGLHHDYQRAA